MLRWRREVDFDGDVKNATTPRRSTNTVAQTEIPHISVGSVTLALTFSIATTLSLDVMADRYRYSVGDISQAELLKRHEVFKRNFDAYEVTAGIDGLPADL